MVDLLSEYCIKCFGAFFDAGMGPKHKELTLLFCRFGIDDSYVWHGETSDSKRTRVERALRKVNSNPSRALKFANALLSLLRADQSVGDKHSKEEQNLRQALVEAGFNLTDAYEIYEESPISKINFETGGRAAIDEQLNRLQKAQDDPALMIGTAKELLEAIAKYVLKESGMPVDKKIDFNPLIHIAVERMNMAPKSINADYEGGKCVRDIYQQALNICKELGQLRNLQGTGHGRTLPTGVDSQTALFVVKIACLIAQLLLQEWDKQRMAGRVFN